MADEKPLKHKPNEKHTLNEVLKSLQDLIRADLIGDEPESKAETRPASSKPATPPKSNRAEPKNSEARPKSASPFAKHEPPPTQKVTPLDESDADFSAVLDTLDQLISKEVAPPAPRGRHAPEPPDLNVVGNEPENIEMSGPAHPEDEEIELVALPADPVSDSSFYVEDLQPDLPETEPVHDEPVAPPPPRRRKTDFLPPREKNETKPAGAPASKRKIPPSDEAQNAFSFDAPTGDADALTATDLAMEPAPGEPVEPETAFSKPEPRSAERAKKPVKAIDPATVHFELEPPKTAERKTLDFDELSHAQPPAKPAAPEDVDHVDLDADHPEPPPAPKPQTAAFGSTPLDDIPVLHEVAESHDATAAKAPPLPTASQARDLAIRVVARLNIERRKAGETPLDIKAIERLQKILTETLGRHEGKDKP